MDAGEILMSEPYRVVSALPTGTAFSRYLMCLGAGNGDQYTELTLAEKFKDLPQVHATLELRTKGAVAAGTTTDATWAGPLATYGIGSEALQLLRGASIIGMLESRMRRVPLRTKVPRETGSGTGGSWIGQGLATPVAPAAYDTLTQEAYKAGVIVVLSKELLKLGDPDSERTVRETVIAGVAAYLDTQFLTNTVTLIADLRPAAIRNGETAVTHTGVTAAAVALDLGSLLAAITTSGGGLVWIMRPLTAYNIAAKFAAAGMTTDIPRSLLGIPLVLSANSPQQVTLVDASHVLYSDSGAIDVDASEQAALQLDSAPANPTVAGTVIESLWPRNLWAVKVIRWLAYLRAQSGAVAYMTVTY
jgi:HK97 family phage major capsid protein